MTKVPKDLVFDARSALSADGEQLKTSCKKREMKIEFRFLNDILAKTVTIKAGSFDAVTHERFLLMAAIHEGLKINWGKLLFHILKDMVTLDSNQARGFTMQNCIILKGAPDLELGKSKAFPPLKILTAKTVGTYVAKNKNINVEEVVDEPVEKVVKKAATKRRPAPAVVEHVAKKKRTTVGRAAPAENDLSIVPMETTKIVGIKTEETVVMETTGTDPVDTESRIDVSAITNYDEEQPRIETDKEKVATDERQNVENVFDSEDAESLTKIPEEMMLPSVIVEEPTKIKFGHGIEIRERDWYKSILPKISATDNGKEPLVEPDKIKRHPAREMFSLICANIDFLVQIREKVIEEISSFFYSFCLRRLAILESVSDIAAKEEQILALAETDSLQTVVSRLVHNREVYREMLLRKFLEVRHQNFDSGTPTTAIDLQVLDMLSDAHRLSLT
ncbi:protein STICHEL-like 4 [Dorcoceras hygrometricum]|uniref:Protein STICHEL-like 4 n=1 Tax=Dorcoceras hygrometricum TaxID=472368 RepID=A0A2Z7DAK3_9LAMI|nr:protein STICHEL-like 4 [Dorcoceras hygrometricum]